MSGTVEQLRYELLKKVHCAAVDVCQWDYEDLDAEPKEDMDRLKAAIEAMEKLDEAEQFSL